MSSHGGPSRRLGPAAPGPRPGGTGGRCPASRIRRDRDLLGDGGGRALTVLARAPPGPLAARLARESDRAAAAGRGRPATSSPPPVRRIAGHLVPDRAALAARHRHRVDAGRVTAVGLHPPGAVARPAVAPAVGAAAGVGQPSRAPWTGAAPGQDQAARRAPIKHMFESSALRFIREGRRLEGIPSSVRIPVVRFIGRSQTVPSVVDIRGSTREPQNTRQES